MRLRRVVVTLVLGALTSWAVAWLGVLAVTTQPPWADRGSMEYVTWVSPHGRIPSQRRPTALGDVLLSWNGSALYETVEVVPLWGGGVPDPIPASWLEVHPLVEDLHPESMKLYSCVDRPLPSWTVYPDAGTSLRMLATHAAGWPWRALSATEEHSPWAKPPNRVIRGAIVFSGWQGNPGVWLPLRPVWGGLVLDTLFHAMFMWVAWSGLRRGLAWVRRRRGVCPNCAYDRRGAAAASPCPECGCRPETAREGAGTRQRDAG